MNRIVWHARTLALALIVASLLGAQPVPGETVSSVRVVALTPAFAEDLFAIGAGRQVVAVSQYTEVPAAARLPRIASFSWIDTEQIVRLHPDLVVGIPAQAALVADARRAGLHVLLLPNDSFDDLFRGLHTLGDLTGHHARAVVLEAQLRARSAAFARRVAHLRRPS
ncbi:MAG TPA: ABC transporter substrate-binding protein, partial [Candidatus Baltobacteraceae bacterium]